ncbi:MAG: hypothetical protein RLY83_237 [Actinomycetota bacterium]
MQTKLTIFKQYLFMALFVVLVRLVFKLVFGTFTFETAIQAIVDGSKLAVWVLGFGLLNVVVDFRKVLKHSPTALRGIATPLGIAFALTPEMAKSVIRIRANAKLRAHRRGINVVRSVMVPMLSNAIDQALNLADSMEARGSARKPATQFGDLNFPNLNFRYPSGEPVLIDASVGLTRGSFTLISGNTGSGKSTLLKVIQAKTPGIGFVGQFPRQTFVAETVFEEIAFSLEQLGLTQAAISTRVTELTNKFQLDPKSRLQELSAGWQQRVAIVAALAAGSEVLLLDEPFSALDEGGSNHLLSLLAELKASGTTIMVAEHRTGLLAGLADVKLTIEKGKVFETKTAPASIEPRIANQGHVKVFVGVNGSGKTTYLRKLAEHSGVLVPQPASDLLFLNKVEDEFKQADLDAKKPLGTTEKLAKDLQLSFDKSQNPRDLSEGQKLALALSIQLAKDTNLLLLDEPTLGFDTPSRQALANLIQQIAESGVEVLVATHDREFASAIATETLNIEQVSALV